MKLNKYRFFFLLVVLMMGLSITGWSISAHYDHTFRNSELQKETKNDSQIGNTVVREFSNNVPILSLISTGLIGLLGIRRQTKKIDNSSPARWNRRDKDCIPVKLSLGKHLILQIFDWTGWQVETCAKHWYKFFKYNFVFNNISNRSPQSSLIPSYLLAYFGVRTHQNDKTPYPHIWRQPKSNSVSTVPLISS